MSSLRPVQLLLLSGVPVLLLWGAISCRMEEREPLPPSETPPTSVQPEEAVTEPLPAPGEEEVSGEEDDSPLLSVDEGFWVGPETAGAEITGHFVSPEALSTLLDREEAVFRDDSGREWTLARILVSVEYQGGGRRAVWRVAGPSEVIGAYLDRLRGEVRSPEREAAPLERLGILPLEVRPEWEERAPPGRTPEDATLGAP